MIRDFNDGMVSWLIACSDIGLEVYVKPCILGDESVHFFAANGDNMLDHAYFGHHENPENCYGFIADTGSEFVRHFLSLSVPG